ncbi:MAG: hypothetical protein K9K38_11390 [Rhodoferax sp.]|nr:hypothetical protein [Rhodoferax sp.]MCF8209992.1 hypothetical protein [Rhodoferax sp.]
MTVAEGGPAVHAAPMPESYTSALSMSFPVGEQCFMNSVRASLKALPERARQRLELEVKAFVV